jgi:hypothetical protein
MNRGSFCLSVGIVVLVLGVVGCGSSGSSSSLSSPPTTTAPERPKFELIISKSSCQETRSAASVNCSVAVKNLGDSSGLPTVYALYEYNDGGSSFDESDNGACVGSDAIPAGQLGFVYFCHTYNALQHDVIRTAVSLNENANKMPYVRVVPPGVVWP